MNGVQLALLLYLAGVLLTGAAYGLKTVIHDNSCKNVLMAAIWPLTWLQALGWFIGASWAMRRYANEPVPDLAGAVVSSQEVPAWIRKEPCAGCGCEFGFKHEDDCPVMAANMEGLANGRR